VVFKPRLRRLLIMLPRRLELLVRPYHLNKWLTTKNRSYKFLDHIFSCASRGPGQAGVRVGTCPLARHRCCSNASKAADYLRDLALADPALAA
jgi:hypothetical protein